MKRLRWFCFLLMVLVSMCAIQTQLPFESNAAAPPEETVTTVPLYRLSNAPGIHFYTTSVAEKENAVQSKGYRDEGVAGYVLPKKAHGSVPLFHLSSVTKGWDGGVVSDKHFYSTEKAEIDKAVAQGWKTEEVVGYVAPPSNPMLGTVELYWLYNPLTKTTVKKPLFKTETHIGHLQVGDDDNFYTTDRHEKERAIAQQGYQAMGIAAYVWPGPVAVALNAPAKPMPDLIVERSSVEGTTVTAWIGNQGKHNISSQPGVDVQFLILERDGTQVFSSIQTLGGMSSGQRRPVSFDTLNHNLVGRSYQIRLDHLNKVAESNESNNNTALTPLLRIKINADSNSSNKLKPPSIAIIGAQDAPPKFGRPHMAYRIAVTNWDQYPIEPFQSTKGLLPTSPCGDTRMQARTTIYQGGKFFKMDCKALNSPQDLKSLVTVSSTLNDSDEITVTLIDRLTNETYVSTRFAVGWFGIGDLLKTVGCKPFLGRASSYLCMSDQGMAACENLRQKGKPIECRRAGKGQP